METYFRRVSQLRSQKSYIREGQAHMIILGEMMPGIYRSITGTSVDPFYRDDRINDYLAKVARLWPRRYDDDGDEEITINLDLSWPFL